MAYSGIITTMQITAYPVYKIESKLQRRREHHLQLRLANLLQCVLQGSSFKCPLILIPREAVN